MDFITILFIGIGLAMDASAVSLAKGMGLDKDQVKKIRLYPSPSVWPFSSTYASYWIFCRKSFCRIHSIHRSLDCLYFVELDRYQHDSRRKRRKRK